MNGGAFIVDIATGSNVTGDSRGTNAVDLQLTRTVATYVAAGTNSFLLGGNDNVVSGSSSGISGGSNNTIQLNSSKSSVIAGSNNNIQGIASIISGGSSNTINTTLPGANNSILGGTNNNIQGTVITNSSVIGGHNNTTMSNNSIVAAGNNNNVSADNSFVGGVGSNVLPTHNNSFVWNSAVGGATLGTTASGQFLVNAGGVVINSSGNITFGTRRGGPLILPNSVGLSGQLLSTLGGGNLTWYTPNFLTPYS